MNYKKISKISLVAFIALAIISPSISLAANENTQNPKGERNPEIQAKIDAKKEDIQDKKEEREDQRAEKTCTQLSSQADQVQNRLTEQISKLTQKRSEIGENVQTRAAERTATQTEKRTEWDDTKSQRWEKLQAAAQTDEQKETTEAFITAIQNAVKIKRDAIDAIISDFRAEIKSKITERTTATDSALTAYKSQIASVTSQVKSDCTAGKDAKEVRSDFRDGIKKARETFQNSRQTKEQLQNGISPVKDARKAEIQTVIDTFKASIEAAKTELRSAFSTSTKTETE